ncbi:SDR family NAD(P)-dependent oxidoreductase [Trujillonella endophytica]|uniref:3-oxoacyl-[acyl-carrier protein] reductase n=1 Tax=Trujillonella endophytica TaxID=673521 RepID=A0A1H8VWV3_9ACTN|nr:SDR family NAD(P)-dependent oxidoreductase [Trujillella endophytica]SEP19876.1 3-oxoacyl-[acyl-carrier protein] reductase [Trujillella endophytica]
MTRNGLDLSGRVALVTGAGRTVGLGIAEVLAGLGARVAVNDLDPASAEAAAAGIRGRGGEAVAVPADVTDDAGVRAMVAEVATRLGPVDVLVNAAGIPVGAANGQFVDTDRAEWDAWIDLNLYAPMQAAHAVLPGMRERGWGRVLSISSYASRAASRNGLAVYGAAKAGLESFTRHVGLESAPSGITVNAIALGTMSHLRGEPAPPEHAAAIPVGRFGTPEDVGWTVGFLASDRAAWITGQTIQLNGGAYMT